MSRELMTEWEAVKARISCRAYQDRRIDNETLSLLSDLVDRLNDESGLHIQLLTTDGQSQPLLKLAPAMFDGPAYSYAALVGDADALSGEKIGYYGEKLVLYATQLGLGTCWVAGTYDRSTACAVVGEGEQLWSVIPMGYSAAKLPIKQRMIRASIRARDRKLPQFVESDLPFSELPEWFRTAVESVRLGPSAVNQQPVNFVWNKENVAAKLWKPAKGMALIDLGIAKYHFEVGAASAGVVGRWQFGDNGVFAK